MRLRSVFFIFIVLLVPVIALWVWLSPLAFIPVPWPDDSAFYFVARDLFKWPPRWVMLPQAPFEPTYRIFNFNTMPLYPLLIGLGRWLGIDGSFAIKLWPISAWALGGSLLGGALFRAGLPVLPSLLVTLLYALDPALHWGSVIVRPESLIGTIGIAIILCMTVRCPERLRPREAWDPIAALLALAAYAHFNAVHLVFPVIVAFSLQPRRLFSIGAKTLLYLTPWLVTVAIHPLLFVHQMSVQWRRLAIHNRWLDSFDNAINSLFQQMGSPIVWPENLRIASILLWVLIGIAGLILLGQIVLSARDFFRPSPNSDQPLPMPVIAAAWVLSAIWLWETKPELWFIYYLHVALYVLAGAIALWFFQNHRRLLGYGFSIFLLVIVGIFSFANADLYKRMSSSKSWSWQTYHELVDCVDQRLSSLQNELGGSKPFRVWCPTFPDITIELARRHPEWELTRTNDFMERARLAIRHGEEVEAVVVTETLHWEEREVSAPLQNYPEVSSVWMNWPKYFLNDLWNKPNWKPNRYLCQRGRWQAFLFMPFASAASGTAVPDSPTPSGPLTTAR